MAWIKLTGKYQEFYMNSDRMRSFHRHESYEELTRVDEVGEEEPIWVKETPEEIIFLIREAEYHHPLFVVNPWTPYPTLEVLGRAYPPRKDGK